VVEREELAAWLRLLETPGVGPQQARALLAQAGSLEAAAALLPASPELSASVAGLVERTWAWLQADPDHGIVTLASADFPVALRQTADPPVLLYLAGRRELLRDTSMLAVVGSRKPTAQGRDNAERFARELALAGQTIVSGLALGVEGAAHAGALDAAGRTIAVVGTGLDQVYPRRHALLGRRIAAEGLMLSEYPLRTPALSANFPRRSRIIAGLAQGCLVVEAALQSSALITARRACEAGREVFALPGSTDAAQSRGCHALIRQGATRVETPADVLQALQHQRTVSKKATPQPLDEAPDEALDGVLDDLPPTQRRLLVLMGFDPVSPEELLNRGAGTAVEVNAWLLELVLAGRVAPLAGQLFQRRSRA